MAALNKSKPCGLLSVQPLRTSPAHKSLILDLPSMHFQYPPLAELLMNIKHLNRSRLLIYVCRQMSFYTGSSYTGGQNKTKQNQTNVPAGLQRCPDTSPEQKDSPSSSQTHLYLHFQNNNQQRSWMSMCVFVCLWVVVVVALHHPYLLTLT